MFLDLDKSAFGFVFLFLEEVYDVSVNGSVIVSLSIEHVDSIDMSSPCHKPSSILYCSSLFSFSVAPVGSLKVTFFFIFSSSGFSYSSASYALLSAFKLPIKDYSSISLYNIIDPSSPSCAKLVISDAGSSEAIIVLIFFLR